MAFLAGFAIFDPMKNQFETILKTRFGFNAFRPGQLEAICTLMEKERLLCIQPTGHGKSLLYQLPAVVLDGITLVISPLLALMRDQIMQLRERFDIASASINSDQAESDNNAVKQDAKNGRLKILFVSPEQLDRVAQVEFLLSLPVNLIVIDEAHCISTWGHDFRPSYRQIIRLVELLEKKNTSIKVLALTATANAKTQNDIKQQLTTSNREIPVHRESMDRPNIQLRVFNAKSVAHKLSELAKLIKNFKGNGLVYCATRDNTRLVADYLKSKKVNAAAYHAGFDSETKKQLQHEFTLGKYKVIAATNALGMGIDKSDLRFIIHFDMPGSITAYYQEVGRCGRDGLPASGILLFNAHDKKIQEHFISSAQPTAENFQQILAVVKKSKVPLKLTDIKRLSGLHPTIVTVVIAELIDQKYLRKALQGRSQVYVDTKKPVLPDLTRYKNQYQMRHQELQAMLNYGEKKNHCRMAILRIALGDINAVACGRCDVCRPLLSMAKNAEKSGDIEKWVSSRTVKLNLVDKHKISEGVSIFNAELRSTLFIQFMRERSQNLKINDELLALIKKELIALTQKNTIACVIAIPSRTWVQRDYFAQWIAEQLKVPIFADYLFWRHVPVARQGELLNSDQRRYNVDNKMTARLQEKIPAGAVLLLDDYTGSGATMKEAARVLRTISAVSHNIIPVLMASVKWRLGRRGMI